MANLESDEVWGKALRLPERERAELAAALIASLDGKPEESQEAVDAAWADEIGRRIDEADRRLARGEQTGTPWREAVERVRARLAK